jgi:hypothetical protein
MPLSTKEAGGPRGRSEFIILSALIVIRVIALGVMVRVVSKPSISQTLRLNED